MVPAETAKQLLAIHGDVRPQSSNDWTGSFALPPAVEQFYREVGPADVTIESHGNPFFLPSLAGLWNFQAGYRWNGLSGKLIDDWSDDWLVVADQGGDPFVFSRSSRAILHALHGAGSWSTNELFPDMNTMAACLSQLGAIVVDAGDEFLAEDCSIRAEFRVIALTRLQELLGSKSAAKVVLDLLEWG